MKSLYFDCFAGISGDMTLGALVDAGVDFEEIKDQLRTLPVKGYTITAKKEQRSHITGTNVRVQVSAEAKKPGRHLSTILEMIGKSGLSARARKDASGIFETIGRAEAYVHQVPIEKVHFHEVGAVDSIVDIVGVAVAIDMLGIESFHSRPVPFGSGFVDISHGRIPVPVPATVRILEGAQVEFTGYDGEIVTPTGAGILRYYCDDFSGRHSLQVGSTGYGLGDRHSEQLPGMLRVILGDTAIGIRETTMEVIETNIDDMNPMLYDAVIDKLFKAGALDVYMTPIHMKKYRPGSLLTVLSAAPDADKLAGIILKETTTLGLRRYSVRKNQLDREVIEVETKSGKIRVKIGFLDGKSCKFGPEYDDCKALSEKSGTPVQDIYTEAVHLARLRYEDRF